MSIRFRLNALLVTLFSLALFAAIGSLVISAGPRIHAENESIVRLSKEFVETTIESLQGTQNPQERLTVLLKGLKDLRHVNIYWAHEQSNAVSTSSRVRDDPGSLQAPRWLTRLASPDPGVGIPVVVNGQDFGELVIAPRADDESAEIWASIVNFTLIGSALVATTLLLMSLLIAHLLEPIRTVGDALITLDAGEYDVRVPETGPPEITDICRKLNRLAATLKVTTVENRHLAERLICIQDEERKELARELHDELGPYLFAMRAGARTIRKEIEDGATDKGKIAQNCHTLLERIETMQHINRRVLHKLRPMGLDEFGLKAKLNSLIAMWREDHADVDVVLNFSDSIPQRDETSNLTIYRIVQEGLTNAFRHSDATTVAIIIEPADTAPAGPTKSASANNRPAIHVVVSDNGRGLAEQVKPSYGITGMSERVWATGGDIRLSNRADGMTLEAWVPASTNSRRIAPV